MRDGRDADRIHPAGRRAQLGPLWRPLRAMRRGVREAALVLGNPFYKPHPKPIFILGNQKSGTSAIAALLGAMTETPTTLDLRREIGRQTYLRVARGELPFSGLVARNRRDFSRELIKEPNLSFFVDDLRSRFPGARFVWIIRDPRDNIRSILDRVLIPGDLAALDAAHRTYVDPGFALVLDSHWITGDPAEHYIDQLASRWNRCADICTANADDFVVVRYEDFIADKVAFLERLAARLGMVSHMSVADRVDFPFQRRGQRDVSWDAFFGANRQRIEDLCAPKMSAFAYPSTDPRPSDPG